LCFTATSPTTSPQTSPTVSIPTEARRRRGRDIILVEVIARARAKLERARKRRKSALLVVGGTVLFFFFENEARKGDVEVFFARFVLRVFFFSHFERGRSGSEAPSERKRMEEVSLFERERARRARLERAL